MPLADEAVRQIDAIFAAERAINGSEPPRVSSPITIPPALGFVRCKPPLPSRSLKGAAHAALGCADRAASPGGAQ